MVIIVMPLFLFPHDLSAENLPLSMREAVRLGLEQNRQFLQAREEFHAADADLSVELNQYTPKSLNHPFVTAKGAYSRRGVQDTFHEAQESFVRGDQKEWAVLTMITVPFFDGGIAKARTRQSVADARRLAIAVEALNQNIIVEIEDSLRAVQSVERRFKIIETSIKLAEEALRVDHIRFSRGLITTTDFLRSQLSLSQLKLDIKQCVA